MKRFIYLILFLIFLLTMKAFYLDPYLSKEFGDANQSAENNASDDNVTTVIPEQESNQTEAQHAQPSNTKEKMPLDKLGDSIADKLQDKIRQKE